MKIRIEKMERKPEKRYRVIDIAKATGLSEGQVNGYFSNREITTKNGLTLDQIVMVIEGKKRGPGIEWDSVEEIRRRLAEEKGVAIVEE